MQNRKYPSGERKKVFIGVVGDEHPLIGKKHLRFKNVHWLKGMTRVRGSSNNQRVLLANYVLGMEIGMLVHDLLYKHAGVDLGGRRRVKEKEKLGS